MYVLVCSWGGGHAYILGLFVYIDRVQRIASGINPSQESPCIHSLFIFIRDSHWDLGLTN